MIDEYQPDAFIALRSVVAPLRETALELNQEVFADHQVIRAQQLAEPK